MASRKRWYFRVFVLLFLIAAIWLLLSSLPIPTAPAGITVSLAGYTNLPNNQLRFALLSIANHDRWAVRWRGASTEIGGEDLLKAPIMNAALPWISTTPLKRGRSQVLAVGEPMEMGRWRVQLRFSRCTFKERLHQFAWTHKLPSFLMRFFPGPSPISITYSAWMSHTNLMVNPENTR